MKLVGKFLKGSKGKKTDFSKKSYEISNNTLRSIHDYNEEYDAKEKLAQAAREKRNSETLRLQKLMELTKPEEEKKLFPQEEGTATSSFKEINTFAKNETPKRSYSTLLTKIATEATKATHTLQEHLTDNQPSLVVIQEAPSVQPITMEGAFIINRGPCAQKLCDDYKKIGIPTFLIYTKDDEKLPIVQEHIQAGRAFPVSSYMNQKEILDVIGKSGVSNVHPGWGFLSENEAFAKQMEQYFPGRYIAPNANFIETMGNKAKFNEAVAKIDITRTIPGITVTPADLTPEGIKKLFFQVQALAETHGDELIFKGAKGGGGKEIIRFSLSEGIEAFENTLRASLKNQTHVLIQTDLSHAKHVEYNVLVDKDGAIVILAPRECSVQRDGQKVMEVRLMEGDVDPEAIKAVPDFIRKALTALIKNGQCHPGVGTMEFLVKGKNAYALEFNTRLQVEHSISEHNEGLPDISIPMIQWDIAKGKRLEDIFRDRFGINKEQMEQLESALPKERSGQIRICVLNPRERVEFQGKKLSALLQSRANQDVDMAMLLGEYAETVKVNLGGIAPGELTSTNNDPMIATLVGPVPHIIDVAKRFTKATGLETDIEWTLETVAPLVQGDEFKNVTISTVDKLIEAEQQDIAHKKQQQSWVEKMGSGFDPTGLSGGLGVF